MSLRPPSSPSPSPGPENGKHSRQSLGPSARGTPTLAPGSPRLGGSGARPTSELVGSAGMYQTPEAEALDQWFENLQNYEATLEDMAAASLDVNFKEELSAIEQWFKVLSEAERTAALYSLLQHSTQVQIRFFITVLQQMARSDPMTALLSPAVGGSMQAQMEAKLAGLKSPGLKSGLPASPTARNFNQSSGAAPAAGANRNSLVDVAQHAYLSPESASVIGTPGDAASTLAQQRAKLKAANAAHRISAPIMPSTGDRNTWGSGGLGQVAEANRAPSPSASGEDKGRPKSTEFTGRPVQQQQQQEATVPAHAQSESWASMVTTPLPMFAKTEPKEPAKAEWKAPGGVGGGLPGVPRMGDPTIHRRGARPAQGDGGMYDDNGNFVAGGGRPMGRPGWQQATSPGLSATSSNNRFGGSDDGSNPGGGRSNDGRGGGMNTNMMGMGMGGGFNGMGSAGMNGMGGLNPFGVNMNMLAMGISPETQLLAAQMAQAQMAAAGGFGMGMGMGANAGMNGNWLGGGQQSAGMGRMMMRGPATARTPKSATSSRGGDSAGVAGMPKGEEDVDPALLADIPAWLRSLRLHKYTPNFEGMRWQDMVVMDEAALEGKGVAALGARRKMLKTFEVVRTKMGIEGGPPMTSP
ncbi:hypothetical protein B0H16DRAFT_1779299 [Mycena metata]|uniref:RNA-binding protein VTS1 n=1 Tax=Mycena metata TaxID=1033252 RepID=A0AAD7HU22_9AGAR|nr:hypothetical protein B0H16DRAFT_1779299 [Mycena metata]